ncbi:Serine proteinase stubble [Halotydeus destructor]|nr:Serine proteinase stubble [Halotydeus destructor]
MIVFKVSQLTGVIVIVLGFSLIVQLSNGYRVNFRRSSFNPFSMSKSIRPLPCKGSSSTLSQGVCMFSFDCMKEKGTPIGHCIDSIYVGSCCRLRDREVVSTQSSTSIAPSTELVASSTAATTTEEVNSSTRTFRVPQRTTTMAYEIFGVDDINKTEYHLDKPLVTSVDKTTTMVYSSTSSVSPEASDATTISPEMLNGTQFSSSTTMNANNLLDSESTTESADLSVTTTVNDVFAEPDESESTTQLLSTEILKLLDGRDALISTLSSEIASTTESMTDSYLTDLTEITKSDVTTLNSLENLETTSQSSAEASISSSTTIISSSEPVSDNFIVLQNELTTGSDLNYTTSPSSTAVSTQPTTLAPRPGCGVRPLRPKGRVVGGRNAHFGEWPWQVLIKESTLLGLFMKTKCGGVLIDDKWVLTAAHCQPGFLSKLLVIVGEYDLTGDFENLKPVAKQVKRMIIHRGYNPATFENDIALLELESAFNVQPHVIPICLPNDQDNYVGSLAHVVGWGKLSYGGAVPSILQVVRLPILMNNQCQQMFLNAGHVKSIRDTFVCAGYTDGGKDSCEGDSGGPLMVLKDGRWQLVGTVSHGIKCAEPNLPGVYMRTSAYKPWIESIIERKL